jgi:hypothetical protein
MTFRCLIKHIDKIIVIGTTVTYDIIVHTELTSAAEIKIRDCESGMSKVVGIIVGSLMTISGKHITSAKSKHSSCKYVANRPLATAAVRVAIT